MMVNPLPDPYSDSNDLPPDHIPDELVRMYGREAQQSVRYSRSRRHKVGRGVQKASTAFRDVEIWSVAGMVFFWGVAALAILGGLAYSIYLWPVAGLSLLGAIAVLGAVALSVGVKASRRQRVESAEQYPNYRF